MAEGQKVYVATYGEHDDYRVIGVFLREEDAKNCPLADDYFEETLRTGPMDVRTRYRVNRSPAESGMRSWLQEYDGDDQVEVNRYGVEGWDQDTVRGVAAGELSPFDMRRY